VHCFFKQILSESPSLIFRWIPHLRFRRNLMIHFKQFSRALWRTLSVYFEVISPEKKIVMSVGMRSYPDLFPSFSRHMCCGRNLCLWNVFIGIFYRSTISVFIINFACCRDSNEPRKRKYRTERLRTENHVSHARGHRKLLVMVVIDATFGM